MRGYGRELTVVALLALLLIGMATAAPNFFEPQPLLSRLTAAAPKLVVACAVSLVIITRQIDISVGSLFAVCSVVAGIVASAHGTLPSAMVAAVLVGTLGGAINGVLVAVFRLPSIVVTLATMVTWREGLRLYQQGVFLNLPENWQWFGLSMHVGQATLCGVGLLILVFLAGGLRHLAGGRYLYAVGSDSSAARLAGISPPAVTFWTFTLAGALVGWAAVMSVVQSPQVDPGTGKMLELEVIAAAVVGGITITGGRGSLWGMFAGFLLLTFMGPSLTYLGVKPYWDKAFQGGVILLSVVAERLHRRQSD
ncbi:MAG TPA: ABC transporter permease [Candidatus Limnocylindria bacterium]|jgi:rhamnose transport system permease protein|nr:ABC transporter permease [Candidatus Limnocylindria bacterium]